jgi:hypothetical protein
MPHWAGMLTEEQHPRPLVKRAIRQASWDLFFAHHPVSDPPDFVADPGLNVSEPLGEQPLRVLAPARSRTLDGPAVTFPHRSATVAEVRSIRARTNQSWTNISKAIASLQGHAHEPFGTANVEASAMSIVRRICRDTGLCLDELELVIREITDAGAGTSDAPRYRSPSNTVQT